MSLSNTATALASSVGSLFGSGKMKSLERRNEDLQDRTFHFKIDWVSHVNWFRKKMNEFREKLGVPTRKQNRGIKF